MRKRIEQLEAELKEAGKGFEAQRAVLEQKRADMQADYERQIAELKAAHLTETSSLKSAHQSEVSQLQSDHSSQLKKETDDLKKDKEDVFSIFSYNIHIIINTFPFHSFWYNTCTGTNKGFTIFFNFYYYYDRIRTNK